MDSIAALKELRYPKELLPTRFHDMASVRGGERFFHDCAAFHYPLDML